MKIKILHRPSITLRSTSLVSYLAVHFAPEAIKKLKENDF